jgi:hypothetical protein
LAVAKQAKTDRQAVIDSIRKQQQKSDRTRGLAIVAVCGILGLGIVAAAAWKPISDRVEREQYASKPLDEIGAKASACGEIIKKDATGEQDHVAAGTPMTYEDAPPAFGQHWDMWDTMDRKFYSAKDRPELGELVHNLEHGYTMLWYDETAAKDDDTMSTLRGLAAKFPSDTNLRDKFKVVPWTKEDGKAFPKGMHVAMTHWSVGGRGGDSTAEKQEGIFQYCSEPSGAALEAFMTEYPYMDSPEPDAI